MLFYKGFFLVLLGMRSMIASDDRWNKPFSMIRDGEHDFEWSHTAIAAHLARGESLPDSVAAGRRFVAEALRKTSGHGQRARLLAYGLGQ